MHEPLEQLVQEAGARHNRLVLVVNPDRAGRNQIIDELAAGQGSGVFNVGLEFARILAVANKRQRQLQAATILREITTTNRGEKPLVLNNLEILFDRALRLDPLDILRRLAHGQTVVAAWPGALRDGRLIYAAAGHPEHQDYPTDGLILFHPH
jgi:hypothetical protein